MNVKKQTGIIPFLAC